MDKNQTLFAFQLADQVKTKNTRNADNVERKWQARDDIALAGCTDPNGQGDFRYGTRWSYDGGLWC